MSIWYVIANLIIFVPKREVSISIEDITSEVLQRKNDTLDNFNAYLESFYNTQDTKPYEEPMRYIPHYFYYDDVKHRAVPEYISGSEADLKNTGQSDTSSIDTSIKNKINQKLAEIKEISQGGI